MTLNFYLLNPKSIVHTLDSLGVCVVKVRDERLKGKAVGLNSIYSGK